MARLLDTASVSAKYRARGVDLANQRILVTRLAGSAQEKDITLGANCGGFGRIRHFRRTTSPGWPQNPLPIDPSAKALGLPATDLLQAQVFQNAVCNWRCWYCFVPFELLAANEKHAAWLSAADLLDLYEKEPTKAQIIDLTGGQPDLTPEWVPWMMRELMKRGLQNSVYLWSDDNLSNDYFWTYLSPDDRALVTSYRMYGRVCCFKGFDAESFSFNTLADPSLFDQQFELFRRLLDLRIDLYAYATFTTPSSANIADGMRHFVDRLRLLHPKLPLRTIPLRIHVFKVVAGRMDEEKQEALKNQEIAIAAWNSELERHYSKEERVLPITEIVLH